MTSNLETPKFTEGEQELFAYLKEVTLPRIANRAVQVLLFHAVGRLVAPKVFTSFGRTYLLAGVVRGLLTPPKALTEDEMARAKAITTKLKEEKGTRV